MAGPKRYQRPRRASGLVALAVAVLIAFATVRAARVLAPPEFARGDATLAAAPSAVQPPAQAHGYVDTVGVGSKTASPIPADRRIVVSRRAAIRLRGWAAASMAPPAAARSVGATLDGRRVAASASVVPRPDVAQAFSAPALARAGYALTLRAPGAPGTYVLQVVAAERPGSAAYAVGSPLRLIVR